MGVPEVTVYSAAWCGLCHRVKALLERRGIAYREVDVEDGAAARQEMMARSGRRSVPQVFIGDRHVGGAEEFAALERNGELDRLLAGRE